MKYKFDTTPEKSKQMAKVHSKNGKDEVILRKLLWHYGVRCRTNYKELPGKPDIAITKYKVAVFVDGEFWHGYEWEKHKPRIKRNRDYWIYKIEYNMKHDHEVNKQLKDSQQKLLDSAEKSSELQDKVDKIENASLWQRITRKFE